MKSQWCDKEAQTTVQYYGATGVSEDLALRTYASRLIGSDSELVLHGGGNTSVKTSARDCLGEDVEVLHIKCSGKDLATVEPQDHPAVRMGGLLPLKELKVMKDEDILNIQRMNLLDTFAPNPSIEILLHAFLPHKYIDHTHADAILSLVNQENHETLIREIYGSEVGIVPYTKPGFELAKLASNIYKGLPSVRGLVLIHHGIFTFAETAKESYETMIELVSRAEKFIESRKNKNVMHTVVDFSESKAKYMELAPIMRGALSVETTNPHEPVKRFIMDFRCNEKVLSFLDRKDLVELTSKGPGTPDHVIWTKRKPLILNGLDDLLEQLDQFRRSYHQEFIQFAAGRPFFEPDSSPRVILIPGVGLVGIGQDLKSAKIAADLYEHNIYIIEGAETIGAFAPLDVKNLFEMEHWTMERAKLGTETNEQLKAHVVLVTGAGSGIGAETARLFSSQGASVVLWDIDEAGLEQTQQSLEHPEMSFIQLIDVTSVEQVEAGYKQAVLTYGGIDIVISNAGKVWNEELSECSIELMEESFALNFTAHHIIAREAVRIMKCQNSGGCILFNASKSTFNPGPKMGPYTIPKSAVIALMKQYAIECGEYGIRSNAINADRINTNLFSNDLLEKRAASRGLSVDEYLRGNLLKKEVTAHDVARSFLHLAQAFKTTGAVMPVDGGNIAASPR